EAARSAGVRHVIFTSTVGASAEHPVPLFRIKAEVERQLRESGMTWTILRPNAFMDVWFAMLIEMPIRQGLPSGKLFALTHNYTGNAMVKQAKAMVDNGELGNIRKIQVQYLQGWLSTAVEKTDNKQASWRTDPKRSGIGGALGDIGTHAENLVEYITGLKIEELAADLGRFGKGRTLDDDGNLLLRMENGAKGTMSISQIALGEENNLAIRVYGEKGSIEWHQENPNELITRWLDKPKQIFTPNGNGLYPESTSVTRIPAGHPEGYLEAFATIYKNFAMHLMAIKAGKNIKKPDYPTVEDGIRGMKFIYASVESDKNNAAWVKLN
ncbi:MAG: Gfo/Idh/MocA family oxidoreductase, partial [Flavobacteriales bacterium]